MILVEDLSKIYASTDGSTVRALNAVSLEVTKGEFVSIIGPSGCGKTTLLSIMAGLNELPRSKLRGINSYCF